MNLRDNITARMWESKTLTYGGKAQKSLQRFTLFQMYPDRKCLMQEACTSFVRV